MSPQSWTLCILIMVFSPILFNALKLSLKNPLTSCQWCLKCIVSPYKSSQYTLPSWPMSLSHNKRNVTQAQLAHVMKRLGFIATNKHSCITFNFSSGHLPMGKSCLPHYFINGTITTYYFQSFVFMIQYIHNYLDTCID